MEQWQPKPVIKDEPRTARLTMPSPTAPLLAQPSLTRQTTRQTTPLTIKPPKIGRYTYWDVRANGYKLDYKKRDSSLPGGWRYLYLGFWSRADMLALVLELSPEDVVRVLRVEMNKNAKLYLKRKQEQDKL